MGQPIPIEDADDPRVTPYRAIRERDLVGREGRFVAEGTVVLAALLAQARFAVESVLVLENRMAGLGELLARAPAAASVYRASQRVMDGIAGFHIHRGVLAIGRRPTPLDPVDLLAGLPPRALVLCLVGLANHDNIGAIFRNAAAFGADAVLLDDSCCDPLYRKAIRVSVGAVFKVPYAVGANPGAISTTLLEAGFEAIALSPGGRDDLRNVQRGNRAALFLGTEGQGLPPELLERLRSVRIGMAPGFDSLNVAAASAIALHALTDLP